MMTVIAAETAGVDAGGALSPARLYLLRAGYLVLVVGLGLFMLPELVRHDPLARGVIPSLLGAVWLLALIGLRWPLQMIPLLLFELAWKTIWLLDYGLWQWSSGRMPATFAEDFKAIAMGVVLMPIMIPWGYVVRQLRR